MTKSYRIISQNKHWICVWKNALTLSVPSRFADKETRPCVGLELQDDLDLVLFPTHRLDYEVAGLLLFAKNPIAHREINRYFEERQIKKVYRAKTLNKITPPNPLLYKGSAAPFKSVELSQANLPHDFNWSCRIAEGKRRSFVAPHGKESQTLAQAIEVDQNNQISWWLNPQTGRQHQLRLHMCLAGYPIIGDERYGGEEWDQDGISLFAVELDFSRCQKSNELGLPERFSVEADNILKADQ